MPLYEIIGVAGVLGVLFAYFMLASGRWAGTSPVYLITNIVATLGILYSLTFDINWPSVLTQVIWIGISVVALIRSLRRKGSA